MESNYTYLDAFNELQQIVADIETGDVDVDELASKIHRASELITVCKTKLIASEEEVERLLNQLQLDRKEFIEEIEQQEEE